MQFDRLTLVPRRGEFWRKGFSGVLCEAIFFVVGFLLFMGCAWALARGFFEKVDRAVVAFGVLNLLFRPKKEYPEYPTMSGARPF